jgi:hypothetical protein
MARRELLRVFSLHPVTVADVSEFLAIAASSTDAPGALPIEMLRGGDSRGPELLGLALAAFLANRRPSFVLIETSLTSWEAQIDRGVGMLLRPPARLFVDAGLERSLAQQLAIRLDHAGGRMAGAFVPAHLVGQLEDLLEDRLERDLRRLREAELDPVANMGLILQAVAYARANQTGLIEAIGATDGMDPGARVVVADRSRLPKDLRKRLEAAAKPPKKPGLIARLLGGRPESNANGINQHAPAPDDPTL